MPIDFRRLTRDEQKMAKLIASRLWVPLSDVAAAMMEAERCSRLVDVPGLTLQVCEAYHELINTSREAGVTGVNPPGVATSHGSG